MFPSVSGVAFVRHRPPDPLGLPLTLRPQLLKRVPAPEAGLIATGTALA